MRRFKITIGLIAVFFLASCGNSISSDAQKLADLECKSRELHQKMRSGDTDPSAAEELDGILKEMEDLVEAYEKKYTSDEQQKELEEVFLKATKNCE